MNTFLGIGTYKGEHTVDSGLRFLQINIPGQGKGGHEVPLYVSKSKAAGEIVGMLEPNTKVLLNGRLYPSRRDYLMYLIPNSPIQIVQNSLHLNEVTLGGGFWKPDTTRMDIELFKFQLLVTAPQQDILQHTWQDTLGFNLESWGNDAKRILKRGYVGRQTIVKGVLRYYVSQTSDGKAFRNYSVKVRSGLYQFFGKNKDEHKGEDVRVIASGKKYESSVAAVAEPYQSAINKTQPVSNNKEESTEMPF